MGDKEIGATAQLMAAVDGDDGDPEAMEVLLCVTKPPAHFPFVALDEQGEVQGIVVWQTIEVQRTRFILSLGWLSVKRASQRNGLATELIFETIGKVISDPFLRHREFGYFIIEVEAENESSLAFCRNLFPNANEAPVGDYIHFTVQPEEVLQRGIT